MDVTAVVPVSLERVQAVTLNDAAREGKLLEAKVTAMLSNTLARLAIGEVSLDVATPRPLPVGAMLTLKAERQGGELRLITQGPIREPQTPAAAARGQAVPAAMLEPVKAVLAKVQALAVEAMLADTPTGEVTQPQTPFTSAPPAPAGPAAPLPTAMAGQTVLGEEAAGQPASPQAQAGSTAAPPPTQGGPASQPLPGLPQSPGRSAPPPHATLPQQAGSAPLPQQAPGAPVQTPAAPGSAVTQPDASPLALMAAQGATEAEMLARVATPGTLTEGKASTVLPGGVPHHEPGIQPQSLGATPQQAAALAPVLAEQAFEDSIVQDEGAPATAPAAPQDQARSSSLPSAGPHAARPETGIPPEVLATVAREVAAEARDTRAASAALSDTIAAYAASDPGASQARTERAASLVVQLPLHFPGNPTPLRLEVERDEGEAAPEDGGEPRPPSWTIRFAAEARNLGMVHAAITYMNEQIGVRLWAERGETAALFNQAAPQLQDALQASDLRLEALTIAEGRPAERQPAGAARPAMPERRI
jgi:hypothetical protein